MCKLLSSLCCYDWLSISDVLLIRVFSYWKNIYFDMGLNPFYVSDDKKRERERESIAFSIALPKNSLV